ncbi:MAG: transposase [Bdellovibrionota bacterium]
MKQIKFNLDKGKHGGRREGSGRKRLHSAGVAHRKRERVNTRTPLHINFKYKAYIRNKESLNLLKRAILNARKKGLRIIHFSLQSNHIHLIVEASSNQILTAGMRSLAVTMVRGLKKGNIQLERYHLHVLKSLREIKNAVEYVCFNKQKHENKKYSVLDDYGSFPGHKMIAAFTLKKKITLKVMMKEFWAGDSPHGFLLTKTLYV